MDLVSLETPTEDEMIKEFLTKGRNIIHKLPSIRVFSVYRSLIIYVIANDLFETYY